MANWFPPTDTQEEWFPPLLRWILYTGFWRDDGIWLDWARWKDYPDSLYTDPPDTDEDWQELSIGQRPWTPLPPPGDFWSDA